MTDPHYSISTPENVDLHLELAGIGNRILAAIIDTIISYVLVAAVALVLYLIYMGANLAPLSSSARAIVASIAIFVGLIVIFAILFGYYIFFEGRWQGQTPGKKLVNIRVIEQNGQPVSWAAVCIRNLIRTLDFGVVLIGLLSMIVDKTERRFGDLAAGTLVIRERMPDLALNLQTSVSKDSHIDAGRLTPQEYELLVNFLKRRGAMSKTHRPQVAKQMEDYFRQKLGETSNNNDGSEAFLERVYLAYQSRAEA